MTENTWPDPARPGVPLHPERDGWHWLKTERGLAPWRWTENPESIMWESGWEAGDGVISPAYFAALGPCTYLGPILTPEEAAALQKRVAELEGLLGLADFWITAAIECREWHWDADQHEAATHTRNEIRAALEGGKDE